MMFEFLQYGFIQRALLAGIFLGTVLPLIGIFLVVRRYALFADTISHISLAGASVASVFGLAPIPGALSLSILASVGIEELRRFLRVGGETLLALFLSGSLAVAIIAASFLPAGRGAFLTLLFGSIITISWSDVVWIACGSVLVGSVVLILWKRFFFLALDEDLAQASGLHVRALSLALGVMASILSAIAIPMTGALLLSALMVIPVLAALQLHVDFRRSAMFAVIFSLLSVLVGLFLSARFDFPPGATIVACTVVVFLITLSLRFFRK